MTEIERDSLLNEIGERFLLERKKLEEQLKRDIETLAEKERSERNRVYLKWFKYI